MKRRVALALAATVAMLTLAAISSSPRKTSLLVLDWAVQSDAPKPPVAVLIELGVKDVEPRAWNGRATVTGARVVHKEGYRFRPGDRLVGGDGWQASSHRGLRAPKGQAPLTSKLEPNASVGVVLHLADVGAGATLTVDVQGRAEKMSFPLAKVLAGSAQPLWGGEAVVRLITTATPIAVGPTEDDFPAAAYGPDGTLWVAYIAYTVRDEDRRIEQKPLQKQPHNFKDFSTPEFADQLFVKSYRNGRWSAPLAITAPKQDLARCAIAAEAGGKIWVAYSAHRDGAFNIFVRSLTPDRNKAAGVTAAAEQQVTFGKGPSLTPVLATQPKGRVALAYQEWKPDGIAEIHLLELSENASNFNKASGHRVNTQERGRSNCWHPTLAFGQVGGWGAVLFDTYLEGDYDVWQCFFRDLGSGFERLRSSPITDSPRFEARPSAVYDKKNRLWIAYEEGPENWGKDYGALDNDAGGNPLYNRRAVKVVCLVEPDLLCPVAELPASTTATPRLPYDALKTAKYERESRYAYPRIGLDGNGNIWLTYRRNFGTRYTSHPGGYWLTFARRLEGDRWSEEIEVHHSDGLLDHRPALLPHKHGGLLIVHNTDGRYTTPEEVHNHIYASVIDLPGDPGEPKLVKAKPAPGKRDVEAIKAEAASAKRMRDHRLVAGGKKYQLLRGEFHRHTEISWDGSGDGSLEDMFRYALDAAGMDWIGNGDHDNGAGREYSWWLIQKFTDAYHVPGHFIPMFSYERSVAYPQGHRNCMFARRGVRTLPRLAAPDKKQAVGGVHPDDTRMLYRYLRELGGICASHTSATSMGTDWRDNDPLAEPVVEIYQGDRMSYEHEGAPRAGYDPKGNQLPANVAGWFPGGFINHALQKGYRLGFQASSDHWSTHISFFVVLAEKRDRDGILDAVKKRHCYGATDNIVLDVRSGRHVMGDEFTTDEAPTLALFVIGTKRLAKVDIVKDGAVVDTIKPMGIEHRDTWTEPRPAAGVHTYYVRVLQEDQQIAWGSPMWIHFKK
jgi:hypothetical protein